jgi:hypothetical protein
MYPRPFVFVVVLTLILAACEPAAPAAPPASTTAISPPATPSEAVPTYTAILTATNTPTLTPSPTPTPAQPVQIQLDPSQAEPGQPVTIHVEGLPPAVVAGKDLACVDLRNEDGRSVAGPIDLSPGESGAFVARLTLPDRLQPGVHHLTISICGTTLETPPESESTPLPHSSTRWSAFHRPTAGGRPW